MDAVDAGVPIRAVNDAFGEAAFQTHEHQQLSGLDKVKGSPPAVFHVLQEGSKCKGQRTRWTVHKHILEYDFSE